MRGLMIVATVAVLSCTADPGDARDYDGQCGESYKLVESRHDEQCIGNVGCGEPTALPSFPPCLLPDDVCISCHDELCIGVEYSEHCPYDVGGD